MSMSNGCCSRENCSQASNNLKAKQDIRVPWYSKNHPMIPKFYIQQWTQDIPNRPIIIHNAKGGGIPTYEHDDTLYLNKREQMTYNMQNRADVNARTTLPSREQMMNTKFHSTDNRYFSHMLSRFPN